MTPAERIAAKSVSRIMRAARKQLGLTQEEVSRHLGISQSALSKLEHGALIVSAPQWFEFCRLTHIRPESLLTGQIDRLKPAIVSDDPREGTFKLPRRYSLHRGSKVRAMLPFLSFLGEALGEKRTREFFKVHKVDPDFFIDLDNQLSLEFTLDVVRYLVDQRLFRPRDIARVVKPVSHASMHGLLHERYATGTSRSDLLQQIVMNARLYECNFAYRVEDVKRGTVDVSITPERHMSDLSYRDDATLGDFLCQYKKHYFDRFLQYGEPGAGKALSVEEPECHYRGAERCVYRFPV